MSVPAVKRGLCSVIVPCVGPISSWRGCSASLLRHTRHPWELITVTRGTHRATAAYLSGTRDVSGLHVAVVNAPDLRSRSAAWLQGLAEARGEYLALVGRNAILTDAWLDQLVALADSDAMIGMVAPMGNAVPHPQRADGIAPLPGTAELDAFAAVWRSARRGRWFLAETLAGPCLLLKRSALAAIEKGGSVTAADLQPKQLARRVRQAGLRLAVANDLFVYQQPTQSKDIETSPEITPSSVRRCRVSLTMIVRDEEENLPDCLASASGLFDEIVVLDTGSTDRTAEIARSFGARVFDFVWVDDFAAARNAALARATGDYAFWLDADDRVEIAQREQLRALFNTLCPGGPAYVVRCACDPDPAKGGGATVVDHVRLFPVRSDVRWAYRVHEQILPALRRAGVAVEWTNIHVRHVGYNDPALRRRKLERDRAILRSELTERPGDAFVLFNVGQVALDVGDLPEALDHLKKSLAASTPSDSITRKLHALIARTYQLMGDPDEALRACTRGLADDPDDAELLFRKGVLHRLRGEAAEAAACWCHVLSLRRPERFASIDEGIYGHVTRRNLAVLVEEQGNHAEAALHWSQVLAERPGDKQATLALQRLEQAVRLVGDRSL